MVLVVVEKTSTAKTSPVIYRSLDVKRIQKQGLLTAYHTFNWEWSRNAEVVAAIKIRSKMDHINLVYRHQRFGCDWQNLDYPVKLDWTDCRYGGKRAWFLCPAKGCGRRVALLYIGSSGIFACRHCNELVYASQREKPENRTLTKADAIRDKLGWQPGIIYPKGDKPKGMHWKTFDRLCKEHDVYALKYSLAMMESLDKVNKRFNLEE